MFLDDSPEPACLQQQPRRRITSSRLPWEPRHRV